MAVVEETFPIMFRVLPKANNDLKYVGHISNSTQFGFSAVRESILFTSRGVSGHEICGDERLCGGIYNRRHRDHGPKEVYYDGIRLREDITGVNQSLV